MHFNRAVVQIRFVFIETIFYCVETVLYQPQTPFSVFSVSRFFSFYITENIQKIVEELLEARENHYCFNTLNVSDHSSFYLDT